MCNAEFIFFKGKSHYGATVPKIIQNLATLIIHVLMFVALAQIHFVSEKLKTFIARNLSLCGFFHRTLRSPVIIACQISFEFGHHYEASLFPASLTERVLFDSGFLDAETFFQQHHQLNIKIMIISRVGSDVAKVVEPEQSSIQTAMAASEEFGEHKSEEHSKESLSSSESSEDNE